jgi:hypothetical protein
MSLLATDLRKRKKVVFTKTITLPEAPKKTETVSAKTPLDVFDLNNETGQRVIKYLAGMSEKLEKLGLSLLLNMPTARAYEAETELLEAIYKYERGETTEEALKDRLNDYTETHTDRGEIEMDWTGKDVPLFYFVLKLNGERLESYTCNYIQVCIIRELWLRTHPETEFNLIKL